MALTLIALLSTGPTLGAETGTIEGRVDLPRADGTLRTKQAEWAWIEADGPTPEVTPSRTMRQVGTRFVPDLLVVPRGTVVEFPNDGPDQHNVHWVTRGYSDNLGTYRMGESEQRAFDLPGVYPIGCHRHAWMKAFILVVPSPWFAPVVEGRFRIEGVPPGTYQLVAWSERGEVKLEAVVEAGKTSQAMPIAVTPR